MGMVTDIQRFSLNDGPGIRTTVFFKGCNARCSWCHNPETLQMPPQLLIAEELCIRCGACVGFDPERAAQGLPPAREALTLGSADVCFSGALTLCGREVTVDDVMREVRADRNYYQQSGGGLTLSGGEAMMQPEFAMALLRACRDEGIGTAVETNLAYEWPVLEAALPLLDLVMADIKLMDPALHRQHVGLGNEQILDNARRLAQSGTPYIIRTPIIPGVNDSEAEISAIAAHVASLGGHLMHYELLNFNPLGGSKYERLAMDDAHRDARPLPEGRMASLADAARAHNIPVQTR